MAMFKKISTGLAIGTLSVVLIACSEKQATQFSPPQVSAFVVHKKEVPINFEYAARIVPFREVQVRSRVNGILLKRNFIEGAAVKQGDVLFEIDPDQYDAAVAAAQSQVAQAQANYDQSVRAANRAEELVIQKVQSTAMRDQAFATRDANQATLMQTQAQLRSAQLNLDYTKVTAPISGFTSRDVVSEGSLIGTDASSSLLTTITQLDPVYVNFSFADDEYQQIRKLLDAMKNRGESFDNLKVTVKLGEGTIYPQQGSVDFTSPTIDAETGTLGARAVISNPESRLVPGMFVRVTVTGITMANAMVIPEEALMQNNNGQFVYVLKDAPPKAPEAHDATAKTPQMVMAPLQKGARLKLVEQRPIETIRQLPNGEWLLDASQNDSTNTTKIVRGLDDGDEIVTQGQVYIQQYLTRLPAGQALPVQVTGDQTNAANTNNAGPAQ